MPEYTINKKSDSGMSDFGQHGDDLSPNTHNKQTYYSGDCWSSDCDKTEEDSIAGTEDTGDYALDNKNPAIMNKHNYGSSRHDELEEHKLPYQPADIKKFQRDDFPELENTVTWHVASDGFQLTKTAVIKKTPNKEEYKIFSEKGKVLGTYTSKKQAEERLKQIEMFKHMDKKADYFDWKGQQITEEPLGTPEKVIPQNSHKVWPESIPERIVTTSKDQVPGCSQTDSALTCEEDLETEAKVVGDVKGKVVQPVTDGSGGFSGTRSGRGARASAYFDFEKKAATPIQTVPVDKTRNTDLERNDQTPYNSDGKGCFSYTPSEIQKLQESKKLTNMQPVNTAIPGNFMDRLYNVDNEKMAEGDEFGSRDFFITPTNQNVELDGMTDAEKANSKKQVKNQKV